MLASAQPDNPDENYSLVVLSTAELPLLAGHLTPKLRGRAESFYTGVAEMFGRWAARRPSPHTRRATAAMS